MMHELCCWPTFRETRSVNNYLMSHLQKKLQEVILLHHICWRDVQMSSEKRWNKDKGKKPATSNFKYASNTLSTL